MIPSIPTPSPKQPATIENAANHQLQAHLAKLLRPRRRLPLAPNLEQTAPLLAQDALFNLITDREAHAPIAIIIPRSAADDSIRMLAPS